MLGLIEYLVTHTRISEHQSMELIHKGLRIGLTIPQMETLKSNLDGSITCMLLGMSYAQVLAHHDHLGLLYAAIRSGIVDIRNIPNE